MPKRQYSGPRIFTVAKFLRSGQRCDATVWMLRDMGEQAVREGWELEPWEHPDPKTLVEKVVGVGAKTGRVIEYETVGEPGPPGQESDSLTFSVDTINL